MIMRRPARRAEDEDVHPVDLRGFDDYETRLGDMLRGERATLGKSLLDVQRELRIKAAYIAAIENSDPSAFDTPGFVAGYVRSYARYLNLDPDETFKIFCDESGFSLSNTGLSNSGVSNSGLSKPGSVKSGLTESSATKKPDGEQRMSWGQGFDRDPFRSPSTPFVPGTDGLFSQIEPRAIGSMLVLLALIGGIGYGGWTVLKQIQQVQVAPVEQTPVVLSNLDPLTEATETATATDETLPAPEALDRLYRPQALDVPVLVARDAPIATLDPRNLGSFGAASVSNVAELQPDHDPALGPNIGPNFGPGVTQALLAAQIGTTGDAAGGLTQGPNVPQVVEDAAPTLRMVTVRPSWVRVRAADGSVIFEGIMKPGESFDVPATEEAPTLRAGESGAVYFAVNGTHYGPVGAPGAVTKNVAMSVGAVQDRFAVADLNQDRDLQRMVAEAQGVSAQSSASE